MTTFHNNQLHLSGWHVLASIWQDQSEEWPRQPYVSRCLDGAGMVVWTDKVNNANNSITTWFALLGGKYSNYANASVIVLNDVYSVASENKWHTGPNMNGCRVYMGACVCRRYVYVMGGRDDDAHLDTIERIPVSHLSNDLYHQDHENIASVTWTTLSARLTEPRMECAAATVHDRFIVVVGGHSGHNLDSVGSLVDIIDTMTPPPASAMTNNKNNHLNNNNVDWPHPMIVNVSVGPRLRVPRSLRQLAVVDDRIWVVGGLGSHLTYLNTVECLQYASLQSNHNNNDDTAQSIFSSSVWTLRPDLSLRQARGEPVLAAMGHCLVVAGGYNRGSLKSAELLDLQRGAVLDLPDMTFGLGDGIMVETPRYPGPVVIGSHATVHMKSLPCVNLSLTQLKKYSRELLELRKPSSFTPSTSLVSRISEGQEGTVLEELLFQRSHVQSLCQSLVHYFLFHKGGHVACLQKYQQQEPELQRKRSYQTTTSTMPTRKRS